LVSCCAAHVDDTPIGRQIRVPALALGSVIPKPCLPFDFSPEQHAICEILAGKAATDALSQKEAGELDELIAAKRHPDRPSIQAALVHAPANSGSIMAFPKSMDQSAP
jgi:hypothetical protein